MTRRLALALLTIVVLAGCGVPTDGAVRTVDPPVTRDRAPRPAPTRSPDAAVTPAAFFTTPSGRLVGVRHGVVVTTPVATLQEVLAELTAGPAAGELSKGLGTALPPTMSLHVLRVADGVATLDVVGDRPPSAELTTAIAQVVLSVTSVPSVDGVRLTLDGQPLDAPLPGGALTARPLRASDYRSLVVARWPDGLDITDEAVPTS